MKINSKLQISNSYDLCSITDDPNQSPDGLGKTPKVICHVFESDEASFIAQSIGQAFQVSLYSC